MTNVLDEALALAAKGIPVFPCLENKRPATPAATPEDPRGGYQHASTDADEVRRLWQLYPGPLIGVPTGIKFDLLDFDFHKHPESWDWYLEHRHLIPPSRAHRSGSGGLHLLFQPHPLVRCWSAKIAVGVDTKGLGGYAIWWPAYGCEVLARSPLAEWPDWLLSNFKPKPVPKSSSVVRVPNNRLIIRLVQLAASAHEGKRNSLTFWCACRAGEMVVAGQLGTAEAIEIIAEAATRAGLPRAEAMRTAKSGVMRGGNV